MKLPLLIILALPITIPIFGKNHYRNDAFQKQFNKANEYLKKGKHDKAIKLYQRITRDRQDLPHVYFNLGMAYMQNEQYVYAISSFKTALDLKYNYPKAAQELAKAYELVGQESQAKMMYKRAVDIDIYDMESTISLARLCTKANNLDEAISLYKEAARLQPKNIQLLLGIANALNMQNQTEEALEWYKKLLIIMPTNPAFLYNIAYTLKKLNRLKEALSYYHRALEINPKHAEAHFGYGLALLLSGNKHPENWTKGWTEYEWRWLRNKKKPARTYSQPRWKGSDLHGKTLFIWSDQGLGDTFEFVRYAYVAKKMGAHKVIVATQNAAYDIIKLCPYIDQVIPLDEQPPHFDYHSPMLSMPHCVKTKLHTVPNENPYLFASQALIDIWRATLNTDKKFKIGICWRGSLSYESQFLCKAVAARSMMVHQFLPLMEMPNVSIYSLQRTTDTDQLEDIPTNMPIILFDGDFDQTNGRFMDTAAVMKNLDLVITIDTSICHLAAGLGVPTWNLLPNPPDWRWMLDCDNTPWYPNMRLFRQQTPGDWTSVIEHVVIALKAHLEDGEPLISFSQPYA